MTKIQFVLRKSKCWRILCVMFFLGISLSFISCQKITSPRLKEIDKQMSVDFCKGVVCLDSVSKTKVRVNEIDSLYVRLLMIKKADLSKQSIVTQKDELISLTNYFYNTFDDYAYAEALFFLGRVYFQSEDLPCALDYYFRAENEAPENCYCLRSDIYSQKSDIYLRCGLYEEAEEELQKAIAADSVLCNNKGLKEKMQKRNYLLSIKNQKEKDWKSSVCQIASAYNFKKIKAEKLKSNDARILLFSAVVSYALVLLSMIVLFIFVVCYLKKSKDNLRLKLDKYENLKNASVSREKGEMVIRNSGVYKDLKKEETNGTYKISDPLWQGISLIVNEAYPNFDHNLRLFYDVSLHELRVCLLLKMGFSPTSIAKFTSHSKEAITSVRSRLYFKVFKKKGSAPKWDEFLKSL